ncbi:MAG: helix-turn-helix domain-containing protein [Bacteroidaceae bacterium]|nr:helix-turn-helix domain-containing protein [Bacteroidaceae bacterium]
MAKQNAIATNEPEPKYLSAEDVMKRLRISRSTLWRWHKDGFLVHRKVGKYNRYAIEDIIKIEEGCHG